jgi:hypothetical protein
MPPRPVAGLALLLAASLALNLVLLRRLATPAPAPASPAPASTARASPRAPAPPASLPAETAACADRLAACEARSWDLVRQAVTSDPRRRGAGQPAPRVAGTGPDAQAEALCAKAQASLRETWERDRDKIATSLVTGFADPEEQERNTRSEVARMRATLGLGDREAEALLADYREKRLARIAAAQAALAREPRDLDGLLAAARGLYADEDAILERIAGAAGREAWREEQLEGRTVILAIAAAMAGKDWEGAIRW